MTSSFQTESTDEEETTFLDFYDLSVFSSSNQQMQAYLSPKFLARFHKLKYEMLMSPVWQVEVGTLVRRALVNESENIKKLVIVGTGPLMKFLERDEWVGGERWMQQLVMFFAVGDLIQSNKCRPPSVLRIMFYDKTFGTYDARILSALGAEVFTHSNSLHGPGNLDPDGIDSFVFDLGTQGSEDAKLWDTDLRGAVRIGHDIGDAGRIGRYELGFRMDDFPVRNNLGHTYWLDRTNMLKEMIFPSPEPLKIYWPWDMGAGRLV